MIYNWFSFHRLLQTQETSQKYQQSLLPLVRIDKSVEVNPTFQPNVIKVVNDVSGRGKRHKAAKMTTKQHRLVFENWRRFDLCGR